MPVFHSRRDLLFNELIAKLKDRLAPGALGIIKADFDRPSNRKNDAYAEIGGMVDRLHSPGMSHLFKPGMAPAGDDPEPLRTALSLTPARLDQVDKLASSWQIDLTRPQKLTDGSYRQPTTGQLVTAALRRLERPENRQFSANPAPLPLSAQMVKQALTEGPLARHVDQDMVTDATVIKWGRELGQGARPHQVLKLVAQRLMTGVADGMLLGRRPLGPDDVDFHDPAFSGASSVPRGADASAEPSPDNPVPPPSNVL